jgi:uncharacterized protein (DUF1697 family)
VTAFVALLRGVNVAGRKRTGMEELRKSFDALGLTNVVTYLQSGNVVFSSTQEDSHGLADALEARIAQDFGHEVNVLVLPAKEFDEIVRANPLSPRAKQAGQLYHATFLFRHVPETLFAELQLPLQDGERAALVGRVVYLYCPNGYGKSGLNNAYFEKALGARATTRNWRTVRALQALCAKLPPAAAP